MENSILADILNFHYNFKSINFPISNEGKVLKLQATGYDLQTLKFQPTMLIFKLLAENLDSLSCGPLPGLAW